jgi:hypothetical protein
VMIHPRQSAWESQPERIQRGTECSKVGRTAGGCGQGSGNRKAREVVSRANACGRHPDGGYGAPLRRKHWKRGRSRPTWCLFDVLHEEDSERAAVQRVDQPIALNLLGQQVVGQSPTKSCVHDRVTTGRVNGAGVAGTVVGLFHVAVQHAAARRWPCERAAHPSFLAVVGPSKAASAAQQPGGSSVAAATAAVRALTRGSIMDATEWACDVCKCMQMMIFRWRPSCSSSSSLQCSRCRVSVGYAKTEHCPMILITRATLAAG